jgi:glycosyltransferase involved in cell wall biosynthesis
MACGAICAVTDVGDSAKIVGDLGFVAPPREPEALAKAIENALERSKNEPELGERIRSSVIDRFSLERMADRTLEALNQTTIAFIITGLNVGGAETTLYKLLERLDRRRFRPYVISLTGNGDLTPKFEALGFPIRAINLRNPFNFFALIIALRRIKPDIVHTWMYHADLIGAIAARFASAKKIAWCIRNSNLDKDKTKLSTRLVVKLCATLSKRLPKTIISCSAAAATIHEELGYDRSKTRVIPNGFDLSVFKPDIAARAKIRKELALDDQTPLIGLIARYDPQKNHIGFIEAAALIAKRVSRTRFVLVGKGIDGANETLAEAIAAKNLTDKFSLIGAREDIPAICAALDVLVSFSSYGEAFPNVLGEAMACGVPCAATDAGDSAYIVGDTGKIVEIGDARALADAVLEIFALSKKDRRVLSQRARDRIEKNFEIGDMVKRYEACYEELLCAA